MMVNGITSVDNVGELRWSDLMYALEFYYSSKDGITIQCPTWGDIPYVKRAVIAHIGEPDKMLGNDIYYRDGITKGYKYIKIRPSLHESLDCMLGMRQEDLFYVGWTSEEDIIEMVRNGVIITRNPSILSIWKMIGMDAFTAYKKLTSMGYLEDEAQDIIAGCY